MDERQLSPVITRGRAVYVLPISLAGRYYLITILVEHLRWCSGRKLTNEIQS